MGRGGGGLSRGRKPEWRGSGVPRVPGHDHLSQKRRRRRGDWLHRARPADGSPPEERDAVPRTDLRVAGRPGEGEIDPPQGGRAGPGIRRGAEGAGKAPPRPAGTGKEGPPDEALEEVTHGV